jgi:hypothetical protein
MSAGQAGGIRSALGWFLFPLIAVALARIYFQDTTDPYVWSWTDWLTGLGPLVGFGFLAGATLGVPDENSGRRGLRPWLSKRALWVVVGPWAGFLFWVVFGWFMFTLTQSLPVSSNEQFNAALAPWMNGWTSWAIGWIFSVFSWLWPATAAIRRAKRLGCAIRSMYRGVIVAVGFAASLFGSFWAITQVWRDYYFDTRIVPLLLAMGSLLALSGCASTLTYGEVRRRELFVALIVAWTFGLALSWRWLSRRNRKPPSASPPA